MRIEGEMRMCYMLYAKISQEASVYLFMSVLTKM